MPPPDGSPPDGPAPPGRPPPEPPPRAEDRPDAWYDPPDPCDEDPGGGLWDQLTSQEQAWLNDRGDDEPDGPDPDAHPEAYPDLYARGWPGATALPGDPHALDAAPGRGDRAAGLSRALTTVLRPGARLAALLEDTNPAAMDDGALVESLAACRRMASWATARELAGIAELARRRPPRRWDQRLDPSPEELRQGPRTVSREAVEETGLALTLTRYAAEAQGALAVNLDARLPATMAALHAGRLDSIRVRIIEEHTRLLDDDKAAELETAILPEATAMTTGELRDKLRSLLISIDEKAAEKRRERAERNACVRLYGTDDHTATLAGQSLPVAHAAAARARICAIAAALKTAGLPGSSDLVQAQVFIGLLLGTLPQVPPPDSNGAPGETGPGDPGPDEPGNPGPNEPEQPPEPRRPDPDPDPDEPDDEHPAGRDDRRDQPRAGPKGWSQLPTAADNATPGCAHVPAGLRLPDPRLRLLVPWRTLTGMSTEPGRLSWLGPITRHSALDLATAAAKAGPACTWKIIITDDDGHAIAVTRLRRTGGPAPPQPAGLVGEVTLTVPRYLADMPASKVADHLAFLLPAAGTHDSTGSTTLADILTRALAATARTLATGPSGQIGLPCGTGPPGQTGTTDADRIVACDHATEVPGYHVPDSMRDFLQARDITCRSPICRQPAWRSDQDHTIPHHAGGRTCPCNLGAECRTSHQLKQLPGWQLDQHIAPGYFTWTTPAGLTYTVTPDHHPI